MGGRNGAGSRVVGLSARPSSQANSSPIGRPQPRPDQLDLVRVLVAERGRRGLGEPRRDADAQRRGDELEQGPAAGLVERVEPARELTGELRLAEGGERLDHLRQRRLGAGIDVVVGAGRRRPHQRNRLGEIADIVPRQLEQHRIGALGDQRADHVRLGVLERERIGERGQRPAAIRVGRAAEIVGHQPQLVVAAGLVGETIEQFGEAVHASWDSSRASSWASPSAAAPAMVPSVSSSSP